jgi:hypothetical protein
MTTVDGQPVPTGEDGGSEEAVRLAQLDVKLCKALARLNPPHELSVLLHARITKQLRVLRIDYEATDQDTRHPADLGDDELRQAADIIRAIRALPFWTEKAFMGGPGFRSVLSGYALDITSELDKRTRRNVESQSSDWPL